MAMLAEPRRKQKWTLNPRGKNWSDDSNKFGQKMLEKMGWSSGRGLGRNLDGMTEHVRARFKNDQCGVGFSNDDKAKQWTLHQEGYNDLLRKLQNGEKTETIEADKELSGKSLELKSKQSRARVHYRKFTRGKDVNKYTTKDLANIFGKKDLDEKLDAAESANVDIAEEKEETSAEPVGSADTSYGILTIKGGSLTDYFKNKMSSLGRKSSNEQSYSVKDERESDDDRYAGFGFTSSRSKTEKLPEIEKSSFENRALDTEVPQKINSTPCKRKNDYVFVNPALELGDSPEETERSSKRRKCDYAFENAGLELETTKIREKTSNDRSEEKNTKIPDEIVDECTLNAEFAESGKKKRKKRSKEHRPAIAEGFINEAMNLEATNDENNDSQGQFEISRSCLGLANDALDLTDESTGKKRVTFNETVEFDVDAPNKARGKKKTKNPVKLDKFEVDNDKLKKKRKKAKKRTTETAAFDGAFVNDAIDLEIYSQEANDNAVNERKIDRARRKRDRRISSLETIEEAPEEEKERSPSIAEIFTKDEDPLDEASQDLEILCLGTPKPKRKKRRRENDGKKIIEERDNLSDENNDEINDVVLIKEILTLEENDDEKTREESQIDTTETIETSTIVREDKIAKKKKRKKESTSGEFRIVEATIEHNESVESCQDEKTPRRKKDKSAKSLDKENVEVASENTEIVESEKKRKKRKGDKRISRKTNGTDESKDISMGEHLSRENIENNDESIEAAEATNFQAEQNSSQSPRDDKCRKSKKMFKNLFAKSPVLHFAGSNINEIKGYGMDLD